VMAIVMMTTPSVCAVLTNPLVPSMAEWLAAA
jgi:hypothetical protein